MSDSSFKLDDPNGNISTASIMFATLLITDLAERDPEFRSRMRQKLDRLSEHAMGKHFPHSVELLRTMLADPLSEKNDA